MRVIVTRGLTRLRKAVSTAGVVRSDVQMSRRTLFLRRFRTGAGFAAGAGFC